MITIVLWLVFISIAYHKNIDFFCSTVFPLAVLFSVAHNFTGFSDFKLESHSPTSSVSLGWFSCHWCCSCLVGFEFDCVLLFQPGFSLGLVWLHRWNLPCLTAGRFFFFFKSISENCCDTNGVVLFCWDPLVLCIRIVSFCSSCETPQFFASWEIQCLSTKWTVWVRLLGRVWGSSARAVEFGYG